MARKKKPPAKGKQRIGNDLSGQSYCGDEKMSALLTGSGARIHLTAVYGLFYGCLAATRLVVPSHYMPIIFGDEGIVAKTEEGMMEIVGNLMSLWNMLAGWEPEGEYFRYPESGFSNTREGLQDRVRERILFLDYFIKGLNLGETDETDFSEDGLKAMKSLGEAGGFLEGYQRLLEKKVESDTGELDKALKILNHLEEVIEDCIARINLGLKGARMRMVGGKPFLPEEDSTSHPRSRKKVGRNDPCPCGSGKKYKKCCLLH